jgi:hypothetical protein
MREDQVFHNSTPEEVGVGGGGGVQDIKTLHFGIYEQPVISIPGYADFLLIFDMVRPRRRLVFRSLGNC